MGNHHEKFGHKRILFASQLIIPDMAGTTPDPAGHNADLLFPKPNQASCTPEFPYPLVSSIWFASSTPISASRPEQYHH